MTGKFALERVASAKLPTGIAEFRIEVFVGPDGKEHVAMTLGSLAGDPPPLVRVHSECLTGDALMSTRCDCGFQLQYALQRIAAEGRGALLYLRQEGRGIGLINKIKAYALQDTGADTVEANTHLGFEPDQRDYGVAVDMLEGFGVSSIRLMTNNPRKINALEEAGVTVIERVPIECGRNPHNEAYLAAKADKLGHIFATGGEPTP